MTEPTRISIALYRTMAGVVSQLEGEAIVPQAAAAALCTPHGTCVRVSQDQHVETRSILGP